MFRLDKYYRVLELDRVLERLALMCGNSDAAQMARELCPSGDVNEVRRLLEQTDSAYRLTGHYGSPSFGSMTNVRSSARRAQAGGSLSMRELLDVAENLRVYRSLTEWRGRFSDENVLDRLFEGVMPHRQLENRIATSVISEDEMADTASATLSDIRRKIRSAENSVRERLDKIIRSPQYQKYLQEPVVTIRGDRFVVPVKLECRGSVPGLVHDTSSSGATVFIEPTSVVEANNEIKVLRAKEQAEIERILAELSAAVGEHADIIAISYDCAVELCLIFAKARLAYDMKASMPEINTDRCLKLINARHPLLDAQKVVPVSVELGESFDTLVITGPNTGGKTVTLKTIGLLTLMAECGLMVPAYDGSRIAVFDAVMADIGDEQSIEQSLSTFSSHMVNLVDILANATDNSLILVDELGAGTDPIEGAALAKAITEEFRAKGCRVAATTHYAELKAYAIDTAGVENASCEFDVATLRPTYRLLIGVPGRSNAFAISERLGLSPEVVRNAKGMISDEDKKFEGVVRSLEQARKAADDERKEAQRLRSQLDSKHTDAERRFAEMEQEREKILEQARKEAQRIVERANRGANAMLGEIEDLRKQANKAKNLDEIARAARAAAKAGSQKLDKDTVPTVSDVKYELPRPLKVGDTVFVPEANRQGEVVALADKSGNLTVRMGALSMKIAEKSVRLTEGQPQKKAPQSNRRTVTSRADRSVSREVDLRGRMADEAIMELDSFLDEAILCGVEVVTVIHGKGTGALRKAVHDRLKHHKAVRTYRLGLFGEGENGVTIVELK